MISPVRGAAFATLLSISGYAQFYAPETEYHDPVQRVFPVEAARVLAWRDNQAGAGITEIKWSVRSGTNGTEWKLIWLKGASTNRMATVQYPQTLLEEGPRFYREIFGQLSSKSTVPLSNLTASAALEQFWQGASDIKPSREATLSQAFELQKELITSNRPAACARLAGVLAHAALPCVAGRFTIDGVLSARGAAWLLVTEQNCPGGLDTAWTPILFLAGREARAQASWASSQSSTNNAIESLWQLWLRNPSSRQIYLKAVEAPHWGMMMPMLAYDVVVSGSGKLLAEIIGELIGSRHQLGEFHNYAYLFGLRAGVGGGHVMNGAWPVYQRKAWLDLLAEMPVATNDVVEHKQLAQSAIKATPRRDASDPSLTGFSQTVPLLRMSHTNGIGPLAPTAVATVRDVLNYGWESAGRQMGTRYRFVNRMWGIPEQARPIFRTVTSEVQGLIPFFQNQEQAKTFNYIPSLRRLQMVDGFYDLVGWSPGPFGDEVQGPAASALFNRRCWLRPRDFEWQARALWDGNLFLNITDYMKVLRDEGGPMAAAEVLEYLTSIGAEYRTNLANVEVLLAELAEKLPQPTRLYVSAVWQTKFAKKDFLPLAQELERLYWQNPDGGFEESVFNTYLNAAAFQSARRFYVQTRRYILDPIAVSHGRGRTAYVMGYTLNDPKLRRMALEDSSSGSGSDMMMHIWEAAIQDDLDKLQENTQELTDRYETNAGANSRGRRLMKFLTLLPALKDPKHRSRREALTYFGNDANWLVLRWIWIDKFKLPPEDAITLLGGRETDAFRRVLVCYLENNGTEIRDAFKQFKASSNTSMDLFFVAHFLTHKLSKEPEKPDEDLKPANATSTRDLLAGKLNLPAN